MNFFATAIPTANVIGLLIVAGFFILLGLLALWATKGKFTTKK